MEGTKYRLIIYLVLLTSTLYGNTRKDIYDAYINNRMPAWKAIIDQLEIRSDRNVEEMLELVNYQYGYIAWCVGNNHKDEAIVYLKKAENNLEWLDAKKTVLSKVLAYRSAFYGFRIGVNVLKAPFLGPKSSACANQAITIGPDDFFGYIQMGNVQFHAPFLMGGSKPEALKYYLKAKALIQKSRLDYAADWNYLSLLVSIAKTYELIEDYIDAKLVYQEILRAEPEFKWVKDELYPQLLKRLK